MTIELTFENFCEFISISYGALLVGDIGGGGGKRVEGRGGGKGGEGRGEG